MSRPSNIQKIPGVQDILPGGSEVWQYLEEAARRVFSGYGYRELRTPLLEKTELFARAVGGSSDIVEKEMYSFIDRGDRPISLRPEGTAPVVRVFIENSLHRSLPWAVYYMGPMFRYERAQKGRQRQFHQIGCELFGADSPLADAEMLAMVMRFFREVGLAERLTLEINSLGCREVCRPPYQERLIGCLHDGREGLCGDCQRRLERNPLRVLDCKTPGCREIAQAAPHMKDHLCDGCRDHFDGVTAQLDRLGVAHAVNPMMVRGLDYYNRTAFEVTTRELGSQNAVAAGGRYDGLVTEMGGREPVPAIGFAMGLERLALLVDGQRVAPPRCDLYLVAVGDGQDGAGRRGLALAERLRDAGFRVERNLRGGSLGSQMKRADRSGAPLAVIVDGAEPVALRPLKGADRDLETQVAEVVRRFESDHD